MRVRRGNRLKASSSGQPALLSSPFATQLKIDIFIYVWHQESINQLCLSTTANESSPAHTSKQSAQRILSFFIRFFFFFFSLHLSFISFSTYAKFIMRFVKLNNFAAFASLSIER